jgi:hypothetical protein
MKRIVSTIPLFFMIILVGRGQSNQNFRILADVFDSGGLGLSSPRSANFFNSTIVGQSAGLLSSLSQNFKASSGAAGPFYAEPGATSVEDVPVLPSEYALEQNYPNPFNPSTVIRYQLPTASHVSLRVYNMLGQEVATLVEGIQEAGFKSVTFSAEGRRLYSSSGSASGGDAHHLSSGVYFYRLQTADKSIIKRMMLLR